MHLFPSSVLLLLQGYCREETAYLTDKHSSRQVSYFLVSLQCTFAVPLMSLLCVRVVQFVCVCIQFY